jgi:SAM-dependent methyltransferase
MLRSLLHPVFVRFSIRSRTKKAQIVADLVGREGLRTSLLVGAIVPNGFGGMVEAAAAELTTVVAACDIVDRPLPWRRVVADGRALPFRTRSVDLIVSNAVIEHVGDEADQRRFIAEQRRVASWSVITTPNRWFPVESHTLVPFLHWLPAWRRGRREFTRILSRREFEAMLPGGTTVTGRPWSGSFTALVPGDDGMGRPSPR